MAESVSEAFRQLYCNDFSDGALIISDESILTRVDEYNLTKKQTNELIRIANELDG